MEIKLHKVNKDSYLTIENVKEGIETEENKLTLTNTITKKLFVKWDEILSSENSELLKAKNLAPGKGMVVKIDYLIYKRESAKTPEWKYMFDAEFNELDISEIEKNFNEPESWESFINNEQNKEIIIDENDGEMNKEIKNVSNKYEALLLITIYSDIKDENDLKDDNDSESENIDYKKRTQYLTSFGHISFKNNQYFDGLFPFKYISHFKNKSIKATYIKFPFSKTNKSLNGHMGLKDFTNRNGSFVADIDLDINDIPNNVSKWLTGKNKHLASNNLWFNVKKNSKNVRQSFERVIKYICYVNFVMQISEKNEIEYEVLLPVNTETKKELFTHLYENIKNVESKTSFTGFSKDQVTQKYTTQFFLSEATIQITDCSRDMKIKIEEELIKTKLSDGINDKTLGEIISYYNEENLSAKFNSLGEFITKFSVYDDDRYAGKILSYFDFSFNYNDSDYILTDGNFYKLNNGIDEILKRPLEELNDLTEVKTLDKDKMNSIFNKIKLVDKKDVNNPNFTRLLDKPEILFNYAVTNYIEGEMQNKSCKLIDGVLTASSSIEIGDLLITENKKHNLSHVKITTDNQKISYNIDQSITSMIIINNKSKEAKDVLKNNSANIDKVNEFSLVFVIKGCDKSKFIDSNGKVDWKNVRDRNISKFKLTEWNYLAKSNGFKNKIYFVVVEQDDELRAKLKARNKESKDKEAKLYDIFECYTEQS